MAERIDHGSSRVRHGHVAPIVLPGMIEYPPRPGWPHRTAREVVAPLRRMRVSVVAVVVAAVVLLVLAYQVISGFLAMLSGLVN
ncbi:hypothetical protein [Actinokineospora sp. HUAS TT18]|uniref:hypothetical protein n=1 Tax=Actinokineospora sp. HUAS TT18 TaxID=3447451 RepID=UPI003F52119C